ncbi:GPR1/FUN34/yaaH family [Novymonas esmeraldas]|uniref:GPR1/FUN34/yaaH family n=1 Tax=Novymonas esmeraldas TaxID=1808958 RepID=A0AAW0EM81_9TRYP
MADTAHVFSDADGIRTREPAAEAAAAAAVVQPRRRRPRKVVVYYFDSDVEEQREDGVAAAKLSPLPTLAELEDMSHGGQSDSQLPLESGTRADGGRRHHRSAPTAADVMPTPSSQQQQQQQRPISPDNPRIGSPTPIGFFAFGMTTLLYNVHNAKICKLNMATMGLVIMFGGLTQFLCGFFELINMNTLGCTISTTYGAFWMATAVLFLWPENTYVTMGDHTFTGGFFLLWFVFAGTLFASSFRTPFMCMALFFLVPLNFLLQSIGFFADSATVARVAGYEGIVVGALATYLGMAFTLRDVYGRSLLPILFQKKLRYVEW